MPSSDEHPEDPEPQNESDSLNEDEDEDEHEGEDEEDGTLDALARELFGESWDAPEEPDEAPEHPTAAERLLYALGQLLRLHHEGTLPVHPRELPVQDIVRVLGIGPEFEFVTNNRLGCHYHFPTEVLTVSAEGMHEAFPWRLLSSWEWAAEQELNSLWLDEDDADSEELS